MMFEYIPAQRISFLVLLPLPHLPSSRRPSLTRHLHPTRRPLIDRLPHPPLRLELPSIRAPDRLRPIRRAHADVHGRAFRDQQLARLRARIRVDDGELERYDRVLVRPAGYELDSDVARIQRIRTAARRR